MTDAAASRCCSACAVSSRPARCACYGIGRQRHEPTSGEKIDAIDPSTGASSTRCRKGFPLTPRPYVADAAAALGLMRSRSCSTRLDAAAEEPRVHDPLRPVLRCRGHGRRLLPLRDGGAGGAVRGGRRRRSTPSAGGRAQLRARGTGSTCGSFWPTETPEGIEETAPDSDRGGDRSDRASVSRRSEEFFIGFRVAA